MTRAGRPARAAASASSTTSYDGRTSRKPLSSAASSARPDAECDVTATVASPSSAGGFGETNSTVRTGPSAAMHRSARRANSS